MQDQRSSRGQALWKRGAGIAAVAGFGLMASGCFPQPVTLKVVAEDHLSDGDPARLFSFDQDTYVVPHGEVDVVLAYPGPLNIPHTLEIRDNEGALDLAVGGAASRADEETGVQLDPGVYELFCSVVNPMTGARHEDAGMTAQLVVL